MRLVNQPAHREVVDEAASARSRVRRVVIAMVFVSLTLAGVFGRHGLLDVQRYRSERDRLAAEIQFMEQDQKRLEAEVAAIRRSPDALERIAREELGLGRPGEVLVLLKPAPAR